MARASDLVFGTVAVPADGPPPYYPEVVASLEAAGFRRVGGLLAELSPEQIEELVGAYESQVQEELRRSAHTPETILVAPDGSAFAGVDWFFGMPSVRIRTLLADGRVVETMRAWDRMPDQPLAMAPYAARLRLRREQDHSARGRLVTLVEGDALGVWTAHQDAVARSEVTPVSHRTLGQAQELWRQCFLHDARIEMRVGPASRFVLYGLQVVGLTLMALFVLLGQPWWAVGTAGVCIAIVVVLVFRVTWWLRYSAWLRPRFRAR